jgi:hypothetical protein
MVDEGEMPTAVISERDAGRAKRRVREREIGEDEKGGGGGGGGGEALVIDSCK